MALRWMTLLAAFSRSVSGDILGQAGHPLIDDPVKFGPECEKKVEFLERQIGFFNAPMSEQQRHEVAVHMAVFAKHTLGMGEPHVVARFYALLTHIQEHPPAEGAGAEAPSSVLTAAEACQFLWKYHKGLPVEGEGEDDEHEDAILEEELEKEEDEVEKEEEHFDAEEEEEEEEEAHAEHAMVQEGANEFSVESEVKAEVENDETPEERAEQAADTEYVHTHTHGPECLAKLERVVMEFGPMHAHMTDELRHKVATAVAGTAAELFGKRSPTIEAQFFEILEHLHADAGHDAVFTGEEACHFILTHGSEL